MLQCVLVGALRLQAYPVLPEVWAPGVVGVLAHLGVSEPDLLFDDLEDILLGPIVPTRDHLLLRPVAAHFVELFGLRALDTHGLGRCEETKPKNPVYGHEQQSFECKHGCDPRIRTEPMHTLTN